MNPTDTYTRNGSRAEILRAVGPPPYVPGMDVAGVVDEIGDGVETGLSVGDHAMAIVLPSGSHGGYSESLVLPVESVVAVPLAASDVEASTLPMNGLTARLTLDLLGLKPGATLAVTGSAGAYGGYVVELAKADGLRVIGDASEGDETLVRDLGADVLVRRGDDVAARILEVEPGGIVRSWTVPCRTSCCSRPSVAAAALLRYAGFTPRRHAGSRFIRCGCATTSGRAPNSIGFASRSMTVRSVTWRRTFRPEQAAERIACSRPVAFAVASSSNSDQSSFKLGRNV